MNTLKELSEMDLRSKQEKYRNVPEYAIPKKKYSDSDTNSLTQAIIKYLELNKFFVTRIQSQGQFSPSLGMWTYGNTVKGIPDLYAQGIINGKSYALWIEIKSLSTKDKLRPHQIDVHKRLTEAGAVVFIAKDFDSFMKFYKNLKNDY